MRSLHATVAAVSCVVVVACAAPKRSIVYGLQDEPTRAGGALSTYSLAIEPFTDGRPEEDRNRHGSSSEPGVMQRDGDDWWVNSADHYDSPDVATAVTAMVSNHLRSAGLFRDVRLAPGDVPADMRLSGTLRRFDGWHDRQAAKEALVAAQGLVGLVLGATVKSRYGGVASISDVRLVHVASGRVVWKGDIEGHADGSKRLLEVNKWNAYEQANDALKLAVRQLIEQLTALQPDQL